MCMCVWYSVCVCGRGVGKVGVAHMSVCVSSVGVGSACGWAEGWGL